jgi:hypothetical protein
MRVVFLCKRRYMAKDVIVDRYARLNEIPRQLANLGHQVLMRDKAECRRALGLPEYARLIGTAGGLHVDIRSRSTNPTMLETWPSAFVSSCWHPKWRRCR